MKINSMVAIDTFHTTTYVNLKLSISEIYLTAS